MSQENVETTSAFLERRCRTRRRPLGGTSLEFTRSAALMDQRRAEACSSDSRSKQRWSGGRVRAHGEVRGRDRGSS